jgi:Protein of unknown function (DUF1559)
MLEFICPTCGKRMQGDDSLAGQQVQCAACHGTILAPGPAATVSAISAHVPTAKSIPSDPSVREGEPPRFPEPRGIDLDPPHVLRRWMPLLIVVLIGLTVAGLLTPVVQKMRQTAARTQSMKNLQKIGLAFHSFHDAHKRLPFNGTLPAQAGDFRTGSWAFQILPFLDHKSLFIRPNEIDGVAFYMCPGRGRPIVCESGAWTDYFINPWLNDHPNGVVNAPDMKRTLIAITDGTSNTIMLGQGSVDPDMYSARVANDQSVDIFKGGNPAMARRSTTNQADKPSDAELTWGGPFPQGGLYCMCDGTIRIFPFSMTGGTIRNGFAECFGPSGNTLSAYLTPAGGELCGWAHVD